MQRPVTTYGGFGFGSSPFAGAGYFVPPPIIFHPRDFVNIYLEPRIIRVSGENRLAFIDREDSGNSGVSSESRMVKVSSETRK